MDIASLVASFATGTYTVTRYLRRPLSRGKAQDGTTSTITITASVSPSSGNDIKRLPEGRRTNEARTVITDTLLLVGGQGSDNEADEITIDGSMWEISLVETWRDALTGNLGYRCIAVSIR